MKGVMGMTIFKNKYQKIRSGWKIILVAFLAFVMQVMSVVFLGFVGGAIIGVNLAQQGKDVISQEVATSLTQNYTFNYISNIFSMLTVILAVFIILRGIDKKKFKDIGFFINKESIKELFIGLALGALSMAVIFIVFKLTGNITVEKGFNFSIYLFTSFILYTMVALSEEIFSRGYCMYAFSEYNSIRLAVIVSSLIFSLLHIFNPNVNFWTFNIFLVGVLFAYMTLKTRNIMMAIGYHLTWNYFQGSVFGLSVSGTDVKGIISVSNMKTNILTGGALDRK